MLSIALLRTTLASAAATLPTLPPEPHLDTSKYPSCQKDWITTTGADKTGKMQLINSCIDALEGFNQYDLKAFTKSVQEYSSALEIKDSSFAHSKASADDKSAFKAEVKAEIDKFKSIDNQGNFGDGYSDYYNYLNRYKSDVRNLTTSWNSLNVSQG